MLTFHCKVIKKPNKNLDKTVHCVIKTVYKHENSLIYNIKTIVPYERRALRDMRERERERENLNFEIFASEKKDITIEYH